MQIDEEIERAFKAGAGWALENSFVGGYSYDEVEMDRDINEGIQEYINGNSKSDKGKPVLAEG